MLLFMSNMMVLDHFCFNFSGVLEYVFQA